jgi:hypothetical protein
VAVVQSNYWGYLVLNPHVETNSLTSNNTSMGRIELRTSICPVNHCTGGASLLLSSTTYLSDLITKPSCNNEICIVDFDAVMSEYIYDDGSADFNSTVSNFIHSKQLCSTNRDPSPSNYLCGNCLNGYVQWRDGCVECSYIKVGILFVVLIVSFIYVWILYHLSQKTRADAKILIYFIQTALYQLGPANNYLSWLGFVNFDLFQTSGSSCIGPLSAYQNMSLSATFPLLALFELILLLIIHWLWRRFKYSRSIQYKICSHRILKILGLTSIDKNKLKVDVGFPFHKYSRTAITILIVGYLQIASVCINYFNCVSVAGQRVLFTSPSIMCASSTYNKWLPLVLVLLMGEVCMFPLLLLYFLIKNRKLIPSTLFRNKYGVLFESYRPSVWFWQPWVLVRQVIFIVLSTSFTSDHVSQFIAFSVFHIVVWYCHILFQPNMNNFENQIESISHMCLLLMSIVLLATPPTYSDAQQVIVCILVIPLTVFMICVILIVRIPNMKLQKLLRQYNIQSIKSLNHIDSNIVEHKDPNIEFIFGDNLNSEHIEQHRQSSSLNPIATF